MSVNIADQEFAYMAASESSKVWNNNNGTYLPRWMTYQVFIPLVLLQLLNMFWYYFMMRILARFVSCVVALGLFSEEHCRAIRSNKVGDERSDDEDEDEDAKEE